MDYETFLLAVSDIANIVCRVYTNEFGKEEIRDEPNALLQLIRNYLWVLDEGIQQTEKGNNS
jgi:hypothetical protein